jgi:hypothetical protein
LLPLDKFIFGDDVVVDKLLNLNVAVVVQVTLAEKLVHDLAAVVLVDTLLSQEHHHLVLVYVTIAVDVYCSKLVIELTLLFGLV